MNKVFIFLILVGSTAIGKERLIACDESKPVIVTVPVGRVTILNFPISPKEIVPGEAGFDFKTIRQDLIVKALRLLDDRFVRDSAAGSQQGRGYRGYRGQKDRDAGGMVRAVHGRFLA